MQKLGQFAGSTFGGSIIGGALGVGESLLSNHLQKKAWERQNAYNHPKEQLKRLKEAGINPNLMYAGGNSGATSIAAQQQPTTDFKGSTSNALLASQIRGNAADIDLKKAQTAGQETQTQIWAQEAWRKKLENHFDFETDSGNFGGLEGLNNYEFSRLSENQQNTLTVTSMGIENDILNFERFNAAMESKYKEKMITADLLATHIGIALGMSNIEVNNANIDKIANDIQISKDTVKILLENAVTNRMNAQTNQGNLREQQLRTDLEYDKFSHTKDLDWATYGIQQMRYELEKKLGDQQYNMNIPRELYALTAEGQKMVGRQERANLHNMYSRTVMNYSISGGMVVDAATKLLGRGYKSFMSLLSGTSDSLYNFFSLERAFNDVNFPKPGLRDYQQKKGYNRFPSPKNKK